MIKLDVKEKGKKYTDKPLRLIAIMEDCRSDMRTKCRWCPVIHS